MAAFLFQIDGYDPVAGAAVTLRASSVDDDRVCHLDGQTWWPAVASLPSLRYDLVDAAFSGRIETPGSTLGLATEVWPDLPRYTLADARVRMWSGEPGDAWSSYVLRFDGRATAQPAVVEGRATLPIAVDDRWLDTPILSLYAGTTGAEGEAALKGSPKPLSIGSPRFVPGQLIDSVNQVYQLHGYGATEDVEVAFERLLRFGPSAGDHASYAALIAASVPAGRWATAKAVGMVRQGAPPVGKLSYHVKGDKAGPDLWVRLPGAVIKRLALLAGGAGRIHEGSVDALDAVRPWPISLYQAEQVTARELIQRIAASVNAVVGVSWTSQLFVAPVGFGTPSLTLDATGASLPPVAAVEQIEIDPPFWRMAMEAERTQDVHALSDVAFSAVLVERGAYEAGETYREGHIVQHQGSSWLYTNPTPASGNAPPTLPVETNAYWRVLARAGTNAPELILQYSVDGSTGWHVGFVTGDKFWRQSTNGGGTFSASQQLTAADLAGLDPAAAEKLNGMAPGATADITLEGSAFAIIGNRATKVGGATWEVASSKQPMIGMAVAQWRWTAVASGTDHQAGLSKSRANPSQTWHISDWAVAVHTFQTHYEVIFDDAPGVATSVVKSADHLMTITYDGVKYRAYADNTLLAEKATIANQTLYFKVRTFNDAFGVYDVTSGAYTDNAFDQAKNGPKAPENNATVGGTIGGNIKHPDAGTVVPRENILNEHLALEADSLALDGRGRVRLKRGASTYMTDLTLPESTQNKGIGVVGRRITGIGSGDGTYVDNASLDLAVGGQLTYLDANGNPVNIGSVTASGIGVKALGFLDTASLDTHIADGSTYKRYAQTERTRLDAALDGSGYVQSKIIDGVEFGVGTGETVGNVRNRAKNLTTLGRAAAGLVSAGDARPFSKVVGSATAANAAAVSFGTTYGTVPKVAFLPGGRGPAAGANIAIRADNLTASGFTMKATEQTVTAGATITDTGAVLGGAGEPTRVIDRTSSSAPYNGTFRYNYSCNVPELAPGESGDLYVDFYAKIGGVWTLVASDYKTVTGTYTAHIATSVDFGAGAEFGISSSGGNGTVTAFNSVSYTLGTVTETSLTDLSEIPFIVMLDQ